MSAVTSTAARPGPEAVDSLLVLARRLDEVAVARVRLAAEVRAAWAGAARSRFDAERAVRDGAASELADHCRRVAGILAADLADPAAA